jgi:hypothetical protein
MISLAESGPSPESRLFLKAERLWILKGGIFLPVIADSRFLGGAHHKVKGSLSNRIWLFPLDI